MQTHPTSNQLFDINKEISKLIIDHVELLPSNEIDKSLKVSTSKLNKIYGKYLISISLKYQEYCWKIGKPYNQAFKLIKRKKIPGIPKESAVKEELKPSIIESVKKLIDRLISSPSFETFEFLEISACSLLNHTKKIKECKVKIDDSGTYKQSACIKCCDSIFRYYEPKWLIISKDSLMYLRNFDNEDSQQVLFFDSNSKVVFGYWNTGYKKGIIIHTATRKLRLIASDYYTFHVIIHSMWKALRESRYTKVSRFNSFAPECHTLANIEWFIDSSKYFSEIYDAIKNAEKDIFITDWWFSPEIYLKRPVNENQNQETRIDRVLSLVANKGVKVYILVYKETVGCYNDSKHVETYLESLSKNIKVLRHPNNIVFLYTHHEKLCIIDQKIGFLGGIDLCFQRYDNLAYPLTDTIKTNEFFPGIDYYNIRVKEYDDVQDYERDRFDRNLTPRMPRKDVALKAIGEPVKDMVHHFLSYWNFVYNDLSNHDPAERLYIGQPSASKSIESFQFDSQLKIDNVSEQLRKAIVSSGNPDDQTQRSQSQLPNSQKVLSEDQVLINQKSEVSLHPSINVKER